MSYIQIPQLKSCYDTILHKDYRALLNYIAETYKEHVAFIIKHKNKGEVSYENITFEGFRDDVNAIGSAMIKKGWHGKRIAVVGANSYNWMATFFATLAGVGTTVPLDRGLPYEELESSLARSYADVLVFDKGHKEMVAQLKEEGKTLVKEYICMDDIGGYETLDDLREQGKAALAEGFTDFMTLPIDEHAITILLFTSGTTSMSKAVMLSQHNIMSNIEALMATEKFYPGKDTNMAFLPYHHTFGSVGQTLMSASGVTTAYCDGLKYLQKNLVEYKVSVFFCVPLLIESIYKKVMQTVKKQGKEKAFALCLVREEMIYG